MWPSVDVSGQHDWTCVLGSIPEDGDRFFSWPEEYVTGEHAKNFIFALRNKFQEDLIIVLDKALYFRAAALTDLAARDDLVLARLPAYSLELNPVDECWKQLKDALGIQFFGLLDELTVAIDNASNQVTVPNMSSYF